MLFKKKKQSPEEAEFNARVEEATLAIKRAIWNRWRSVRKAKKEVEAARRDRRIARCPVFGWGDDLQLFPGMLVFSSKDAVPVTATLKAKVDSVDWNTAYILLEDGDWARTIEVSDVKKAHEFEQRLSQQVRRVAAGEDVVPDEIRRAEAQLKTAQSEGDKAVAEATAARDALAAAGPNQPPID